MERLTRSWEILCHLNIVNVQVSMDISALRRVVISESDKTYLTKDIDQINKEGLFDPYKDFCHRIAEQVLEICSEYKYSHALVSTLMETSHQQFFFANQPPSLTEVDKNLPIAVNKQVHLFIMDSITRLVK